MLYRSGTGVNFLTTCRFSAGSNSEVSCYGIVVTVEILYENLSFLYHKRHQICTMSAPDTVLFINLKTNWYCILYTFVVTSRKFSHVQI